jgi:DNA-directed RNA polymerase specialized sigma24 family protein
LAEDAAQEAFRDLPTLHEPHAFAAWFRRIVFKHCDRLTRRKQKPMISLDAVHDVACADVEPVQVAEQAELRAEMHAAIARLPEQTRAVTLLFIYQRLLAARDRRLPRRATHDGEKTAAGGSQTAAAKDARQGTGQSA